MKKEKNLSADLICVGEFGRWVMPKETANLRESQTQIAALFTRILSAYRGCGRAAV